MRLTILDKTSNNNAQQYPAKYTKNVAPIIRWSCTDNNKTNIKSFVLIMFDPNSPVPNYIHLYIPYIDPTITEVDLNKKLNKSKMVIGKNEYGKYGYIGPAPPTGTHCYIFTIIGLNYICSKEMMLLDARQIIKQIYDNHIHSKFKVTDMNSVAFYFNKKNIENTNAITKCNKYKFNKITDLFNHINLTKK